MLALNIILLLVAIALCVPVGIFCLEVLLAALPRKPFNVPPLLETARLTVLIPAHNEEAVVSATLTALLPTLPRGSRVLVVADNCSDATATIARRHGVEVIERNDGERRGKGFALNFGIRHLAHDPPDSLIFLD